MIDIEPSQRNSKLTLLRPIRTYNTAVIYYLKYRLTYPEDNRLTYPDDNRFIVSEANSRFPTPQILTLFGSSLLPDLLTRFQDAAATAIFVASKIEDTLKKSTDVLAAAYSLRLPPTEQLIPYDTV